MGSWEPNSRGSRISSKWGRGQGAVDAEFDRRRPEDRVAEGVEGVGVDFGSQIGEFWCKLGAFCTVHLKLV